MGTSTSRSHQIDEISPANSNRQNSMYSVLCTQYGNISYINPRVLGRVFGSPWLILVVANADSIQNPHCSTPRWRWLGVFNGEFIKLHWLPIFFVFFRWQFVLNFFWINRLLPAIASANLRYRKPRSWESRKHIVKGAHTRNSTVLKSELPYVLTYISTSTLWTDIWSEPNTDIYFDIPGYICFLHVFAILCSICVHYLCVHLCISFVFQSLHIWCPLGWP